MKKTYYNYGEVEQCCFSIVKQMSKDKWVPDMVVGITRGGLLPSILISNWFDCNLETLKVSLRRDEDCESNLWLPEYAIGYVPSEERGESGTMIDPAYRKNILIVDDINDTGATLNWIKTDWQQNCLPNNSVWESVWNNNVKVATLFNRESSNSEIKVDYTGFNINLDNDPGWIVFPWESWCGDE
jgi:hypoxanthine phosphoribosyltransferase